MFCSVSNTALSESPSNPAGQTTHECPVHLQPEHDPLNSAMNIHVVREGDRLPSWTSRDEIARFLHETMSPYEDTIEDIHRALDYAFSYDNEKGGFLVLGEKSEKLIGAVVMLHTGMKGYIPETVLVFVSILPDIRGTGLGTDLIRRALDEADGSVKLHVEYDNPAKRLYERIGFISKYAEMRYEK